jgi:hypothetical protein
VERFLWLPAVGAYAVLVLEAVAGANPWPAMLIGAAYTALVVLGSWLLPGRAPRWLAEYTLLQIGLGFVMVRHGPRLLGRPYVN